MRTRAAHLRSSGGDFCEGVGLGGKGFPRRGRDDGQILIPQPDRMLPSGSIGEARSPRPEQDPRPASWATVAGRIVTIVAEGRFELPTKGL